MLNVNYVECQKKAFYAECHNGGCHSVEWHGAVNSGFSLKGFELVIIGLENAATYRCNFIRFPLIPYLKKLES